MSDITAFAPIYEVTGNNPGTLLPSVTVTASATAQPVVLPGNANSGINQIQLSNQTASWAYVNFGIAGSVVAATPATGYPIAPNTVRVITVASEVTGASVILATGATAAPFTFTRGIGIP